ncbi:MAG: thioesterase [Pseudoflavonifractor sp.]
MNTFYENVRLVDTRDLDPAGYCRPSALLGILQDTAAEAAGRIHLSREELMAQYGAFWMLARSWYRLDRPLRWNEPVAVKTWHRGGSGASMYRDFDISVRGVPVGEAVTTWVLADWQSRKLLRMSKVLEFADTTGGGLCKDRTLQKLHLPEELVRAERRRMHYSDADMNGHVNNSRYADFVCDALRMEHLGGASFVAELQMGYLAECLPGEELELLTGAAAGLQYVRGLGPEGRARFDAAVTLGEVPLDIACRPS